MAGCGVELASESCLPYVHAFIASISFDASQMRLSRPNAFALALSAGFVIPLGIPGVGLDYQYFFIMVMVLLAWFMIKWGSVKDLTRRGTKAEVVLGCLMIGSDYSLNILRGSNFGILDMIIVFVGTILAFYGLKSLRLFWIPAIYGVVLLLGYQIEAYTPNFVALQDWLAGVMASALNAIGIATSVNGHIVTVTSAAGVPLLLDVASSCTGIQGIIAFGLLSTMTVIDMKPKASRIIPIFAFGFAGAFLINILRLLVVFLTFQSFGIDAGEAMHVYFGYLVFVAWLVVFWMIAFRYLVPLQVAPRLSTDLRP